MVAICVAENDHYILRRLFTGRQHSLLCRALYIAAIGMSVCPLHAGTESKRRKLGSRNLHCRIAQEIRNRSPRARALNESGAQM